MKLYLWQILLLELLFVAANSGCWSLKRKHSSCKRRNSETSVNPSSGRKDKEGDHPSRPELGFLGDTSRLKREAAGDIPITAGCGGSSVADRILENCANVGTEFKRR